MQQGLPISLGVGQQLLPSQHSVGGMATPIGGGGSSTIARQGQTLPPSVVISHSAPVSTLCLSNIPALRTTRR